MKYINKITDNARQKFYLTGNIGQRIELDIRYLPNVQQWMMDVVEGDFVARGLQLVTSPNLLRGYKNIIKFGICCQTENGLDPMFQDDFTQGRSRLYLLTEEEVQEIEAALFDD